jgi:hypothetical protein
MLDERPVQEDPRGNGDPPTPTRDEPAADCGFVLRGWTGEFLQARELAPGDLRLWHADGTYFGRLIADEAHSDEVASGVVYGPTGLYLADAVRGRLRVNALRRQVRAAAAGFSETDWASPGTLEPVDRHWPRRADLQP